LTLYVVYNKNNICMAKKKKEWILFCSG